MEYRNEAYRITVEELNCFLAGRQAEGVPIQEALEDTVAFALRLRASVEDHPVRKDVLDRWRQGLRDRGLSPRTVGAYVTDVNALLKWSGYRELCFTQGRRTALTGRRSGRLTAVEPPAEKISGRRSVLWRCRCDCGKESKGQANQRCNP